MNKTSRERIETVRRIRVSWRFVTVISVLVLNGCAYHLPESTVHSVAYYAAQLSPPPVPATAPTASTLSPQPVLANQLRILINARDRKLFVYRGDFLLATYPVAIGFNGAAMHRMRGDDKTPLGRFHIADVRWGTQYGPFMLLSYPSRQDAEWGLREGIITRSQYHAILTALDAGKTPPQNTPLGGYIGIHGMGPKFSHEKDAKVFAGRWTAGCVALSNYDAGSLASMVQPGTPVEIVGEVASYQQQIEKSREKQLAFERKSLSQRPKDLLLAKNND
ncbi:MAG: L,D-transpeptidase [Acidithiobacillus sp.]|nr:L,D-transpeptidase [Acidithiobacillus sp.]